MSILKENIYDFLTDISKTKNLNKCKTTLEMVKKDNDHLKSISKKFILNNPSHYIKQKILINQDMDLCITENSLSDYKSSYLYIEPYNIFKSKFDNIIQKIKDKYFSLNNFNKCVNTCLLKIELLKNIFLLDKETYDTELGFQESDEVLTVKMFESDIDLINYYNFFSYLSELNIDFEIGTFSQNQESEIIKYINIITFTTVVNAILREFILLFDAIIESQDYTEISQVIDYINASGNIDLSFENLHWWHSIEDKNVEKMVKKAQKLKDKSEGKTESSKSSSSNSDFNDADENQVRNGGEEEEGKKGSMIRKIKDKVTKVPVMTKTFINKTRLYFHNRKSVHLYKRVLGKIDSLYEFYAQDSIIDENRFKDDPVVLLKDVVCPDIIRIGKEVAVLCDEVENLHRKAAASSSKEAVIGMAEKWAAKIPDLSLAGEKMDELNLRKRVEFGTRTRLVKILTKVNEKIYGYTKESMIVKALPPPNFFMISYIVTNAQEKPTDQSVADIFKSPDSFRIMANAEKSDIFQIGKLMNAVLNNKLTAETFAKIEEQRKQANARLKNAIKDSDNPEEQKEIDKEYKEAMEGFKNSVEIMVKQKIYIAELINIFGNLIQRIDKLCIRCIKQMLAIEAEKADPSFRGQIGRKNTSIYKTKHTTAMANNQKRQY